MKNISELCDTGPGTGGTGGVLLCLCVAVGRSGRLPPCAPRGGRREARADHLACVTRRAAKPPETSGGFVVSRVVWVAAAGLRHQTCRRLVVHLVPHGYYLSGWSYHFLTLIVMVYKPNQEYGDIGGVRR